MPYNRIVQWILDKDNSRPVEIMPPNGKDVQYLMYIYDNGIEVSHRSHKFGGIVFEGSEGVICVIR